MFSMKDTQKERVREREREMYPLIGFPFHDFPPTSASPEHRHMKRDLRK